jgi:hypothetical protein
MFIGLLPGFRELRAPLAAGYVLLLGLWLLLRPVLQRSSNSAGAYRDLVDIADWAGKTTTLVGVSFTAYLLGAVSIAVTQRLDAGLGLVQDRIRTDWMAPVHPGLWRQRTVRAAMEDAVVNRLSTRFLEDESFRNRVIEYVAQITSRSAKEGGSSLLPKILQTNPLELARKAEHDYFSRWSLLRAVVRTDAYVESSHDDLYLMAQRLLGKEPEVYEEYDRLRAEATFRFGLVLPLVFLFVVLAIRENAWWLLATAVGPVLMYLGNGCSARADQGLAIALGAERLDSPVLARLAREQIELKSYEELASSRTDSA